MKASTIQVWRPRTWPARRRSAFGAWLALVLLLAGGPYAFASKVNVANVACAAVKAAPAQRDIRLDLSWDDSWRSSSGPANWDAVWLFAKYRVGVAAAWRHATLSASVSDYAVTGTTGVAASFSPSADGKGVFAYRQADGRGPIRWTGVSLRWLGPTDAGTSGAALEVRVFAVEMVYVPPGPFYLGDGASPGRFHAGGTPGKPALITATPPRLQNAAGGLWAERQGSAPPRGDDKAPTWDKPTGALPTAFPTGFQAFHVQKYEVTQGQYAGFLNTLTPQQAAARVPTKEELTAKPTARRKNATLLPPPASRYTLTLAADGSYSAAAPAHACSFLSWQDATAFADWAALRPMTESEFEKVCRGSTQKPVPGEYAWGSLRLSTMSEFQGIDGSGTETALPGDSNTLFQRSIHGPVRIGIHEAKPTRELAGASYYGVLDLSGNVAEQAVSLGSPEGRSFTGNHGDGDLDEAGTANVALWPAVGSEQSLAAASRGRGRSGFASRGGGWTSPEVELRTSARHALVMAPSRRLAGNGFRGVRSATVSATKAK